MPSVNLKVRNRLLWTAQIVLALVFLFAGSMKFIMPAEKMQQGPIVLPMMFLHFIGICECLGALGLLLPGLLRIRTELTPVAAAGLTFIMCGATVLTVAAMGLLPALFPAIVGVIAAWVSYGRTSVVPLSSESGRAVRVA